MAVPGSGTISLFGIAKELEINNYANTIPVPVYGGIYNCPPFPLADMSTGAGGFDAINTANPATDRPDGSTPHSMSEFYSYDHDATLTFDLYLADDWDDGNTTGARDNFTTTSWENSTLFSGGTEQVVVPGVQISTRPTWTQSPNTGYTMATVVSDQLRLSNTNNPHGMFLKTTDYDFGPSTGTFLSITNVPTTECIAWRFRFKMSSPNNKDAVLDIRMGTSNYSPVPSAANSQYTVLIRDSSDPIPGGLRFFKRATTTHTELATAPSTAYGVGTQRDFVVSWHRSGTGRSSTYTWKIGVGPTTSPTETIINSYNKLSVNDGTYLSNYGWSFRAARFMSTPSTNRNHKYDTFSIARINSGGP